ncbi:uncharacterized protein LOC132394946 [Hypanus sabinus]|uniref:uncharacterized protein LOC132394946 n=1 Tax=Hypanus sabinus TaxID=79690 RepID=UPI0028C44EF2|nr:uncharacterized protein LOC132394946 [Hypanus sabinus]
MTIKLELELICRPTVNLASSGTAIQSSTDENGEAARAIDGSKSADANERSCTRTTSSINPWWMLDLGSTYIVATVRITNRQDCCSERLVGSEVRIKTVQKINPSSDKLCGTVRTTSSSFSFSCHYFMGRYLLISILDFNRILSLCEVEVFGWKDNRTALHKILGLPYMPPISSGGHDQVNLALRGTVSQSSFYSVADAQRAIDGSNSWNSNMNSCTETKQGQNPWWRLDLRKTYAISTVRITNRMDCCSSSNQNLGAEIRIGNSSESTRNADRLCGIVKTVSQSYTFNCPGFTGQYVNIMVPGPNKILALCEVEVFGTETPLN